MALPTRYTCFMCGNETATRKGRRCRKCLTEWRRAQYGICDCGRPIAVKAKQLCEACIKRTKDKEQVIINYNGNPQQRQDFLNVMDGLVSMLRQYRKPYADYLRYTAHELPDRKRSMAVVAAETLLILAQDSLPDHHYRYLLWAINKDAPAGERLPKSLYKATTDA